MQAQVNGQNPSSQKYSTYKKNLTLKSAKPIKKLQHMKNIQHTKNIYLFIIYLLLTSKKKNN